MRTLLSSSRQSSSSLLFLTNNMMYYKSNNNNGRWTRKSFVSLSYPNITLSSFLSILLLLLSLLVVPTNSFVVQTSTSSIGNIESVTRLYSFSSFTSRNRRRSDRSSSDRSSRSTSSSTTKKNSINNNNNIKRSIRDRSPEEAVELIQEIIQIILETGIRAGPQRTIQAVRAISETTREYIPQLLRTQDVSKLLPIILRTLFEKMGATYVKLGQFIASSPTLFPSEYVIEFQKCLDQTEPISWDVIRRVIETEYKTSDLRTIFSYINEKPLASASIAQVHMATLRETNEPVVIKVQKPGIDESLQADLNFIYIAAKIIEFIQPDFERTSLSNIAKDIRTSMLEELNFQLEAKNTIEFRKFLQDFSLLNVATAPRVYLKYTTPKVMVLEYLNGVSMLDETTIQRVVTNNPQQGVETILSALNIWSLSVTSMPWFHADIHAGNLLLLQDGRVGFIDFGIVGRISPKVFNSVNELSTALVLNDYIAMAKALCNMGATEETIDINQFASDIERVLQKMNTVQVDVNAILTEQQTSVNLSVNENEITDLLLDLVEVTEQNGLKLPREFGLLVKQSLYFDRYLKILAPNVDVLNDSRVKMGGIGMNNNDDETSTNRSNKAQKKNQQQSSSRNKDKDKVVIDI